MCALPLERLAQQPQHGLTTEIKFRQLIDLAIGSPDVGHVNFHALHWLLSCFAEKLNIIEDKVDFEKYRNLSPLECLTKLPHIFVIQKSVKAETTLRLEGGEDQAEAAVITEAAVDGQRLAGGQDANTPRLAGGEDEGEAEANAEGETEAPPAETNNDAPAVDDVIPADDIPDAVDAVEAPPAGDDEAVAGDAPAPAAPAADDAPAPPVPAAPAAGADDDSLHDDDDLPMRDEFDGVAAESESVTDGGPLAGFKPENYITKSELNFRLLTLEAALKSALLAEETQHGLSIMKDQLEITMEHLNLLMPSLLLLVQDPKKKRLLQHLLAKLLQIKDENIYIEGNFRLRDLLHEEVEEESALEQTDEIFHSGRSTDECREEGFEECMFEEEGEELQKSTSTILLEQMAYLKAQICELFNKINDLTQSMLELDCSKLSERVEELEDKSLKYWNAFRGLVEQFELSKLRINENNKRINQNYERIELIIAQKVDYNDMEMRLAEKADLKLVARKVSHEKLDDICFQMQKQICEVRNITTTSERNLLTIIDNLYYTLGMNVVERRMNEFRELIKGDINELRAKLQAILDAQNACAALGARNKVLEHVQCLSCDTPCIMRDVNDKNRAPKDVPATKFIGSFVTYAVGNMRKMDSMGYAAECQMPHAKPKKQKLQPCTPRHSGGAYTIMTPKDKMNKIFNRRVD